MSGFQIFPSSEGSRIAAKSLDYATKNEQTLRSTQGLAIKERQNLGMTLPSYFNEFQINLAREQADDDLREITAQLKHAEHKLAWELMGKWKRKQ